MQLLKEINRAIDELDILIKRINKTNNETLFEDNIIILFLLFVLFNIS